MASITTPLAQPLTGSEEVVDRYEAVRQYSLAQILAVWAAAAIPMGILAWVVAPLAQPSPWGPGSVH